MKRIREILLTQYIGAIAIGMMIAQALVGFVSLLVQPVIWYQQTRSSRSVLESASPLPWSNLLPLALTVVLYVAVSYALLIWLYPAEKNAPDSDNNNEAGKLHGAQG
jgi:H+/Cl- antiporter ClcA